MWVTMHNNAELGLFQDSEINIERNLMHFRKPHVRANKLDVQETNISSHCSTEAEIISLDAGLRMDGIPALDLWNMVLEVFHYSQNQSNKPRIPRHRETCCITPRRASAPRIKPKLQPHTTVLTCFTLTRCLRMQKYISSLLCCTCSRTMKP